MAESDTPADPPGATGGQPSPAVPPTPTGYYPPPPQSAYQPGPYPGTYPPPPQAYSGFGPPVQGPKNGLGVAALVIAIIGLLSSPSVVLGIVLGIVALIIGFVARGRVKRGEANNGGVALSGIVLGALSIVAGLAFIAIWVGLFSEFGGGDYVDCLSRAGSDTAAQQECADEFQRNLEDRFGVTLTPTR